MRFANDFHSWRKSLANRLTRDPKIVIHGNSCIILYLFYGCLLSKQTAPISSFLKFIIHENSERRPFWTLACFRFGAQLALNLWWHNQNPLDVVVTYTRACHHITVTKLSVHKRRLKHFFVKNFYGQWVSIPWNNCSASNRRQAITWTNDDQICWHVYTITSWF